MDNASKALVMAGGVLIALMIIGALLLMFNNMSNYQKTNVENTRDSQVVEFNNQFSTYNRDDVRGSDLYTLLNRAVDYNTRQTTTSTTSKDAKEKIAFKSVTINVNFYNSIKSDTTNPFSADGTIRLITSNTYVASAETNSFKDEINAKVTAIESTYGATSATNLANAMTKIFIADSSSQSKKEEAIEIFRINSSKVKLSGSDVATKWNYINEGSDIRDDIYTYYEYVQFKRALFKCEQVKYDEQTGRIVQMDFKFTGKLQ